MRFIIAKNIFENIISSMQPFLEKKDSSSITSHIYLEVQNSKLTLKATDYEIGLESYVNDIEESTDGKGTVNGSNLLGIIKRLKNDNIIVDTIDNNLVIKLAVNMRKRFCIQPVCLSWRMAASIIGNPVRPSHHASKPLSS